MNRRIACGGIWGLALRYIRASSPSLSPSKRSQPTRWWAGASRSPRSYMTDTEPPFPSLTLGRYAAPQRAASNNLPTRNLLQTFSRGGAARAERWTKLSSFSRPAVNLTLPARNLRK
ncbi:hypothetical protein B0T24DRAFT_98478 [Lasiosphaeria ovina]|uniref:Uncharacterized protein n=1 Tax=Lasiosphaeria ovina TaxID=92902 RepID=A0AAE0JUV4_9PEZI|nr:hypothetical protein B0T24DRAFT_98478 [Lasiosphaeria ovina]